MNAALKGADEAVAFLLSKGASPDLVNKCNWTALAFAIQTKCSSTIDLLAPVTKKGLDRALQHLATYHTELTPAVEDLLRRARSDEDAVMKGLHYATNFGATRMLEILTQGWDKNTIDPTEANLLLERA